MDEDCGIRRAARRLVCAVGAVCALTLLSAAPALAQSLPSVTQAPAQTGQPAAAPVTQAAAPVAQTVEQAAAPVTQAAAPVVPQVTERVVELTQPVTQAAASVAGSTSQLTNSAGNAVAPVTTALVGLPTLRAASGGTPQLGREGASTPAGTRASAVTFVEQAPSRRAALPAASKHPTAPRAEASRSAGPILGPSYMGDWVRSSRTDAARDTNVVDWRPLAFPGLPELPSAPGSVAVPSSAGSAAAFVAALVAAFLVAAPGLSRRLRLNTAPWPLPIALPSLERPG